MSKKKSTGVFGADYLRELEENIAKLTEHVESDLAKVTEKFNHFASQTDQISDIIGRGLESSSSENEQAEALLDQLLAGDALEKKSAALGINTARKSSVGAIPIVKKTSRSRSLDEGLRQQGASSTDQELRDRLDALKGPVPTDQELRDRLDALKGPVPTDQELRDRLDALKGPVPTDQELRDRLDALKVDSPIRRTKSAGDLSVIETPSIVSFNEIKPVIATSLTAQTKLAIKEAEQATNLHERDNLTKLASRLHNMREVVETMPSVPIEHDSKTANIVATGLGKIYDTVKGLASSFGKNLAKMGKALMGLVKESPEKRMEKTRENLRTSYETLGDLAGLSAENKEIFTSKHFAELEKMTTPEQLLKETMKVNRAIVNVGTKKLQETRGQALRRRAELVKQRSITGRMGIDTPQPTPNIHRKSAVKGFGR
jgi:hypothetical protein